MKEALVAIILTLSGVILLALGSVVLPFLWPPSLSAAASGATVAYYSVGYQPLVGAPQFIDSLTGAPARPDLYAFRFLFVVVGFAVLVPGLLIWWRLRD